MKLAVLAMMLMLGLPAFANTDSTSQPELMRHHGGVRCGAQNARGGVYWETGLDPAPTLARAMARCQVGSLICKPLGCRPN